MLSRIRQACKTYRYRLPWVLLKALTSRLLKAETIIIYSRDLHDSAMPANLATVPIQVVRIDNSDSTVFKGLCSRFPHGNFDYRLRHEGRQCYVALLEDRISGYAWVADNYLQIDEIAYRYPIGKHEIFIYDCFVDKQCRGAGIYPSLLGAVLQDYKRLGIVPQRVCIASSSVNQASIRGITKAGFAELKRIRYLKWRQRERWWESSRDPGVDARSTIARIDSEL